MIYGVAVENHLFTQRHGTSLYQLTYDGMANVMTSSIFHPGSFFRSFYFCGSRSVWTFFFVFFYRIDCAVTKASVCSSEKHIMAKFEST